MADEATAPGSAAGSQTTTLDRILTEGKMAREDSQKAYAKDLIGEFVNQVLDQGMVVSHDTFASINGRIAQIDELISKQLNEVMHAPEFKKLEASWRGLSYLVMNSDTSTRLKVRLMNVTKNEVLNDLEKATEFDQSELFKKIYEEEYGTFGGNPYGLLIGDYEFGRNPQDIGRARAVHCCGVTETVRHGQLHRAGQASRSREGV